MPRLVWGDGLESILLYLPLIHHLLLLIPPVAGMEVSSSLPSPWADPEACGFPYDPTPDIQNNTICDPDHTLDDAMRTIMADTLTLCREKTAYDIPIIVFLADTITFPDGADDTTSSVEELLNALVTSYDLPAQPVVILLLAVNKPFKRLHREAGKYTTKWILLTVTWVVFVVVFVLGLISIAIYFLKVRHSASKNQFEGEDIHNVRRSRGRSSTHPMSGDIRELTTVSYRSTGHVLLGTNDITAVAVQNCASTDNLLNT